MRWICYNETEAFNFVAPSREQAEKLALTYDAKVLGLATSSRNSQPCNKACCTQHSAQRT